MPASLWEETTDCKNQGRFSRKLKRLTYAVSRPTSPCSLLQHLRSRFCADVPWIHEARIHIPALPQFSHMTLSPFLYFLYIPHCCLCRIAWCYFSSTNVNNRLMPVWRLHMLKKLEMQWSILFYKERNLRQIWLSNCSQSQMMGCQRLGSRCLDS